MELYGKDVDHLRKTIDSPQEEVTVPEIIDESPTASPLQEPPAVYSNEGGTVVPPPSDSVPVITEGSETATLPVEEPVTDTTPLPLLDVTLNMFTDHMNDSMNNTCEFFFMRKRKRCSEWTQYEHISLVFIIDYRTTLNNLVIRQQFTKPDYIV